MGKSKKLELDLNNDGKFDAKDKSLAARALATKLPSTNEKEDVKGKEEESLEGGRVASVDINLKYRKGDTVPKKQLDKWEEHGYDLQQWFF